MSPTLMEEIRVITLYEQGPPGPGGAPGNGLVVTTPGRVDVGQGPGLHVNAHSVQIADLGVVTGMLADAAVTDAKLDVDTVRELVQDWVAALLHVGTGLTITYDDPGNLLTIAVDGAWLVEPVQDIIGATLVGGTNVNVVYNDPAGTITISVTGIDAGSVTGLAEAAQDAVGAALQSTSSITFAYDDTGNHISAVVDQEWASELAQDAVGAALVDSATVNLTYTDATPSITADVLDSPKLGGHDIAYVMDRANQSGMQHASTIDDFIPTVESVRLDQLAHPTQPVNLNNQRAVNAADGTAATDLVTKQQLDAARTGLDLKASARVLVATNVNLASPGSTFDGVNMIGTPNPRMLLVGQTDGTQNGLYDFVGPAVPLVRSADADQDFEVTAGLAVFVEEGTVYADTRWVLITPNPIALGATILTFTQDSGLSQLVAGSGLTKTGNRLDVGAGPGIEVNADSVRVADDVHIAHLLGIGAAPSYAGAEGVFGLDDATTTPTGNPASGGVLYSTAGILKWLRPVGPAATLLPQYFYVADYGPLDTPAHTRATITAALAAAGSTGGVVHFPHFGILTVTGGSAFLSSAIPAVHTPITLEGNGCTIVSTSGHPMITDTWPADNSEAVARQNRAIHVRNLRFAGNNTPGQVGLRVIGSYGATFDRLAFIQTYDGLDAVFCLGGHAQSCFSTDNMGRGFRARFGLDVDAAYAPIWTGAGATNSNSNHFRFTKCRDYGAAGQTAQFSIEGSDGVVLDGCIAEGVGPVNQVYWDRGGATTVQVFNVRNFHPENSPSNASIALVGNAGSVLVERSTWFEGAIMVDASGLANGEITLRNCPFLTGKFRHANSGGLPTGTAWTIDHCGGIGFDPWQASVWDHAIVPTYRSGRRFAGGGDGASGTYPLLEGAALYLKTPILVQLGGSTSPGAPSAYLLPAAMLGCWNIATNPAFLRTGDAYFFHDEASKTAYRALVATDSVEYRSPLPYGNAASALYAGYNLFTRQISAPSDGMLANGEVALWWDRTAGAPALKLKGKDAGGTVWNFAAAGLLPARAVAGTTDTPTQADHETVVDCTSASAVTVTVPQLAAGTVIEYCQVGGGQITFAAGSGVSFVRSSKLKTLEQGSSVGLRWRTATSVVISGELTA